MPVIGAFGGSRTGLRGLHHRVRRTTSAYLGPAQPSTAYSTLVHMLSVSTSAYVGRTHRTVSLERPLHTTGSGPVRVVSRRAQSTFMDCAHLYSPHEDEDGCASSAWAAPGSVPFHVKYLFVFTVGVGSLAVLGVLLGVSAYRGRWMDFQRRLQSFARLLSTSISLRKWRPGSSWSSVG